MKERRNKIRFDYQVPLCYNPTMNKRISYILIIIVLSVFALTACRDLPIGYDSYFNNFTSTPPYTKAEKTLDLSDYEQFEDRDVYFSSYSSEEGIYIISEDYTFDGDKYTINGFTTDTEVLIEPRYMSVIDINGDYAIVTKMVAEGVKLSLRVGLVKIRGEHKGKEYGFSYQYGPAIAQYSFLNEKYMVVLGDKTMTDTSPGKVNSYTYATVYDYTSSGGAALLEVGRLKNVSNASQFQLRDNNLLAIGNNVIRIHRFDNIGADGFFIVDNTYVPFDTAATGFLSANIECTSYYLGNNWFVFTGIYASTTSYDTYEIAKTEDGVTTYLTIRSVRYNTVKGKAYDTDRVALVANSYNEKFIRGITDAANSIAEYYEDSTGVKGYYFQPVLPLSSSVKKGYSLVYYYYYYYVDGERNWAVTFCIYDEYGNRTDIHEIMMPLVFVDGIGLQNSDPNFSMFIREVAYFGFDKSEKVLQEVSDKVGYDPAIAHNGMIISYSLDVGTGVSSMGAYDRDGNLAVPFRYYELTPFFGDYATGSIVYGSGDDAVRKFYRISKTGAETEIEDVYALKNGVYVTLAGEKYGLRSNEGAVLLPTEYDSVSVIDTYLYKGKFVKAAVLAVKDGKGVIYKLS